MDFAFSDSQRRWHDEALRFAREELVEPESRRDAGRLEFWREGYARCARFGLTGLPVPEAYGGRGQDLPTTVAAMEGLGYGCADSGLIFALNAGLWTVTMPIARFGSEGQKRRYLPGLCDGTLLGANGASEPDAGSDIFAMQTRAERRGDGWVLSGRKTWITAGPVADLFLCFATTNPARRILGITAFLVDRDAPGFRVVREIPKLGLKSVPMGELAFEDCRLPGDALLGREGRGAEIFNAAMGLERGGILASTLGTMRRQLERCIHYARTRKQFGQSIGKFQSVSNRIVDMHVRLETSRLLVYRYAWLAARGQDVSAAAATAKLQVSETFVQNSLDAIRTFGALGYAEETGLERDLRDGVGGVIFSGTSDIQRNIIAQHLLRLKAEG
jgi:alkylation response protein AidB-like acyl-CoA dehydrogenase